MFKRKIRMEGWPINGYWALNTANAISIIGVLFVDQLGKGMDKK